jgi:diketogulonate reductase-like aldo/keto reductase
MASANVKPVVNQILLHPYVIKQTTPLLEFMAAHHIVPEGYSTLIPLTSQPGGPVDKPVNKIAERLNVKPEQVLLAWSAAKK